MFFYPSELTSYITVLDSLSSVPESLQIPDPGTAIVRRFQIFHGALAESNADVRIPNRARVMGVGFLIASLGLRRSEDVSVSWRRLRLRKADLYKHMLLLIGDQWPTQAS